MSSYHRLDLSDEYGDTGMFEVHAEGGVIYTINAQDTDRPLTLDLSESETARLRDFLNEHYSHL